MTLALLASTAALNRRSDPAQPSIQFVVPPPEGWSTHIATGATRAIALSPDGRRLAFIAQDKDGRTLLWVRPLDATTAQPLKGTEDAVQPFWSPDGAFLAFTADRKLMKINVAGGPPQTIADGGAASGSWNPAGAIVFSGGNSALSQVSAAGGAVSPVTTMDHGDIGHYYPSFLPDGQHFLYCRYGPTGNTIFVGALNGKEREEVMREVGQRVVYAQGRLFFTRAGTLMAQGFDAAALTLTGEPSPIAEIGANGTFSVSTSGGVLAYQFGRRDVKATRLAWFDRTGQSLGAFNEVAPYNAVELSPDGSHAVGGISDQLGSGTAGDVWLYDVTDNRRTRLTFDSANTLGRAVWAPDGRRVIYGKKQSGSQGPWNLIQKASDGTGSEEAVWADGVNKWPSSWSPDGRFLLYVAVPGSPTTGNDLWVLPLVGDRKPFPYLQTRFNELYGQFSPDGRWVAYGSNESGRNEIYVATFPGAGGKRQVSTSGGSWPKWRRDGKELFYLDPNGTLMAAAVNSRGASFDVTSVTPLFATRIPSDWGYDVSPDGQRFLMISTVDDASATSITVVTNWPTLLKK